MTCLAGLAGAALGLLVGTVGVYYGCVLIDFVRYPDGVPAGGGFVSIGWLFVLITAPAGAVMGGAAGLLAWIILGRRKGETPYRKTTRRNKPRP